MISDIAYSHYSFRWFQWFHAWIRCNGHMAIAKEKEETESHEECINTAICTAIALQSIRLFQSLLHCNCSLFRPPTPACIYIYSYVFTPGLYRIDMGVFLALWQWAWIYLQGHCSAYPERRDRPTTWHLPPCASLCIACDSHGSNRMVRMWRMKH